MTRSILVADPSATIRRVVELTLGEVGYYVESAATGAEALTRIARFGPDLVLADTGLCDPSGYEICRSIKLSARPVPVLLLVGAFEAFDEQRAAACGADGRLAKPFEARQLREQVERLLETSPAPVADAAPPPPDQAQLDAVVRATIERMAEPLLREVAREVLPAIAERVVRERIRELEREEPPR